jgi:hypothetical protein
MSSFELGQCVATPGAIQLMDEHQMSATQLLIRHQLGDWGTLDPEDDEANKAAVEHGHRVMSVYQLGEFGSPGDNKVWVITEADRSSTTILLPSEY